jgi:hypothetical protein
MWSDYDKAESRNAESRNGVKRRALKFFAFLLAGAIINVAVAWGFAFQPRLTRTEGFYSNGRWCFTQWDWGGRNVRWFSKWPFADVSWEERPDLSPHWASTSRHLYEPSDDRAVWVEDATGWPKLSVVGRCKLFPGSFPLQIDTVHHAILLKPGLPFSETTVLLPYDPIWPGFAINTIFYAAVLWVLCAVPVKVRRWRRIKRGQCASCGYSLHGTPQSEKCPECGATAFQYRDRQGAAA